MTARRKKRLEKNTRKTRKIKIIITLFTVVIISVSLLLFRDGYWNGVDKLSLVIQEKSGDIVISTFDPGVEEIVNLKIPADTQVEVARGLGIWKISAVWELSENENLTGYLVTETITRFFKFPVYIWADRPAIGFSDTNPFNIFTAALFPYNTNLKFSDRIKIALFSLQVKNPDRIDIDLSKTPLLKKTKFIDGSEGFKLTSNPSYDILSVFSDPGISKEGSVVVINDSSDKIGLAEKVGEIVEVVGAKVVSIKKEHNNNVDCIVKGEDIETVIKIAYIFSCKTQINEVGESFDLEITIGSKFAERY